LVIDEDSRSLDDIVASIRSMRRKHRVEIVVVDYIGLVTPPDPKAPREQQVAAISRRLKEVAKEQEITVIACAQLNRMLENRNTKRPQLADLRESGAIEQDADIVLFVHRPGRYDDGVDQREAEIIVAKQRQGDTGIAKLEWHGAYTEFVDPRGAF
jgi:replicative DNA helicase